MQLVTGNRLRDGAVVYFAGAGCWSQAIDEALVVADDQADALLAEAQKGPAPLPTVAPVLVEAVKEGGHIRPLSLRERVRASGPTTGPMAQHRAAATAPAARS